ncbi:MAG: helix-turn-helix transcriptional regulator [Saprospiraceae bacterium]|nr:helix-turn-helix transcriptional regulator [Saprospiraceae bacterium]
MNTHLKIKHINHLRTGLNGVKISDYFVQEMVISDFMVLKKDGEKTQNFLLLNETIDNLPIIILTPKSAVGNNTQREHTCPFSKMTANSNNKEVNTKVIPLNVPKVNSKKTFNSFSFIDKQFELKKINSFLYRTHIVLEDNLDNYQFSVEVLAEQLHLSRMQVHRKLKTYTNRSASNYIRSYRLYKSKSLLNDQDRTISEIAWEVGFNIVNYYSKSFTKEFGMSPTEYRDSQVTNQVAY